MRFNHLAILVTVILQQVLGFIWYSPYLFLRPWLAAIGKTESQIDQSDPTPFVVSIIASFLFGYVVSILIFSMKADTFKKGGTIGAVVWLGFIFPQLAMHYKFIGLSWNAVIIDSVISLLAAHFSAAILTRWKKT